jgi:non-ribosomal peptide synthetase component F
VTAVSETTLEAFSNQDLPFDQLVKQLHPKRAPSHTPIFQVTFEIHQSTLENNLSLYGLDISILPIEKSTARFDLDMAMTNNGREGLRGALEYNGDLFDKETIKRLLGHFQRLLEGIVADPNARISEAPWLTDPERQLVLKDGNSTSLSYPRDSLIQGLFEAQVERVPEAVAVECGEAAELWGVRVPCQSTGALSAGARCRPECISRSLCRALGGDGGRVAGYSQGRGCVCTVGPGIPEGALGIHSKGCAGRDIADPG